jgi:hypothetical protein
MYKLPMTVVAARARGALLVAAISMGLPPPFAHAERLPASVLACSAESDPGQRLACFDKEVARFVEAPPRVETHSEKHGESTSVVVPAPAKHDQSEQGNQRQHTDERSAPQEPRHVTARIVSIKNATDDMVVSLDNGEVWEQVQHADGTMNLRAGDTVTIDKSLGSYWLSGRSQMVMKVRRKE